MHDLNEMLRKNFIWFKNTSFIDQKNLSSKTKEISIDKSFIYS